MTGSRRIRRRYRLTTVTSTVGLTDAPAPWPQPTVAPTTVESDRSFNNSSPYASCDDSPGHHRTQNDCGDQLEDHHAGEPVPQRAQDRHLCPRPTARVRDRPNGRSDDPAVRTRSEKPGGRYR